MSLRPGNVGMRRVQRLRPGLPRVRPSSPTRPTHVAPFSCVVPGAIGGMPELLARLGVAPHRARGGASNAAHQVGPHGFLFGRDAAREPRAHGAGSRDGGSRGARVRVRHRGFQHVSGEEKGKGACGEAASGGGDEVDGEVGADDRVGLSQRFLVRRLLGLSSA